MSSLNSRCLFSKPGQLQRPRRQAPLFSDRFRDIALLALCALQQKLSAAAQDFTESLIPLNCWRPIPAILWPKASVKSCAAALSFC